MKKLNTLTIIVTFFLLSNFFLINNSFALNVSVSIKPLYSLVSMITDGIYSPNLIIKGNNSPHSIKLSLKNVNKITQSDVVFISSKNLEIPIYEASKNIGNLYEMINFKNLTLLNFNSSNFVFKNSVHSHEKNGTDFHIWLDPQNAIIILQNVANILSNKDPKNANLYQHNLKKYTKKINQLHNLLKKDLHNYKTDSFAFYHNGFAYLENRYNLHSSGILDTGEHIGSNLTTAFSNKKLIKLNNFIKENNISCVFVEPELQDKVFLNYLSKNNINYTYIDPIGYNIKANADLYYNLLVNISLSFKKCFNK